jgi:uncharacterized protein
MINRFTYLSDLAQWIDKPLIKVITGLRRSGKSTLLNQIRMTLMERGIPSAQIVHLNFESFSTIALQTAGSLFAYFQETIKPGNRYYLLLDEIQEVESWEKVVNSLAVDFDVDIFLTGSNSYMLSSDLATYLAGRYVEIPVYTLSYGEFLQFRAHYAPGHAQGDLLRTYLQMGGFPVIHTADYDAETAYRVIRDIYASVVLRDTIKRYKIRDVDLLERVIRFVFDNLGNTFSGKNVADYLKSENRKTDVNTIYHYLTALEGSFLLYRVSRYDLKGKEVLKTMEKFFVGDLSLVHALMGYRDRNISGMLENLVFLELKRRNYHVYVGKLHQQEIDFIAEKNGHRIYIQVAYKLDSQSTVDREFRPLLALKDHYPKFVITMDAEWQDNIDGVRHCYFEDFLLGKVVN